MPSRTICPLCGRSVDGTRCPYCASDSALCDTVEGKAIPPPAGKDPNEAREEGRKYGAYRVIRLLGEGGFGKVYLALQTEPIRRHVALKVLKSGTGDPKRMLARFDLERQALALMDHPSICRVYDAGETESGAPYFAMEVVDGRPITKYCQETRPPLAKLLALYRTVCSAVEHAHQRGVIHRDLKPSNILVVERGGEPRPVVIDFGIAKSLEPLLDTDTILTLSFQMIGTPVYMSPEQANSGGHDADVRSDVYALGAVLYELLTGRPPISPDEMRKIGIAAALRQICEVDTPPPSTRIVDFPSDGPERSPEKSSPLIPARRLRGELDWITMRALAKDRQRRYQSARELADDLARFTEGRPVLAGPPSLTYRARKFARRHPVAVVAVAMLVLLGSVWLGGREIAAAAAAEKVYTRLKGAPQAEASFVVAEVRPHLSRLHERLRADSQDERGQLQTRINATLSLAAGNRIGSRPLADLLLGSESPNPDQAAALQAAIAGVRDSLDADIADRGLRIVRDPAEPRERRLCAASLLAASIPSDSERWIELAPEIARLACSTGTTQVIRWAPALQSIATALLPSIERVFMAEAELPAGISAAVLLGEFRAGNAETLARLAAEANPAQFRPLANAFLACDRESARAAAIAKLEVHATPLPEGASEEERDAHALRGARAAMLVLLCDESEAVWLLLKRPDWGDPRLRTFVIHGMAECGILPAVLAARLSETKEPSERAALLIALGGYSIGEVEDRLVQTASQEVSEIFMTDPHAEVHSAAEWLLRSWEREIPPGNLSPRVPTEGSGDDVLANPAWERDPAIGIDFAVFHASPEEPIEFLMGSPQSEPHRDSNEFQHRRTISYSFAIATKVLTFEQLKKWVTDQLALNEMPAGKDLSMPGRNISLYAARMLCNTASAAAGLSEEEWCYTNSERPRPKENITERSGYRLPTEAEWEFACRGGSSAPRSYGYSERLLSAYACISDYGGGMRPPGSKRPNGFGMYDMLGNVQNFIEGQFVPYPGDPDTTAPDPGKFLPILPGEGPQLPSHELLRGQHEFESANQFRSARRAYSVLSVTEARYSMTGVRLARTLAPPAVRTQ